VPTKERATVLVNKIQYSKIKAAASQKASSETEQFTKIMWAAVSHDGKTNTELITEHIFVMAAMLVRPNTIV